jgi:hypothetical protein
MGVLNLRTAYRFDPETDDNQYSGGLLGRLQAMMQSQGGEYFQPGADSGSTPNSANNNSDPQGGLLGRLLARQAEQSSYQPFSVSSGQAPSEPRDPNFRRLARVYITDPRQDGVDPDRPGNYSSQRIDDPSQASGSNTSAPAPAIKNAQLVLPGGMSLPPPVPVPPPQIPMPAIPDWWKAAGPILRGVLSGMGGGGNDGYRRCMRAADGSTEQWEEFCRNLASGTNNTAGGETQNRACWSKTYESETNKKEWCSNQFGSD